MVHFGELCFFSKKKHRFETATFANQTATFPDPKAFFADRLFLMIFLTLIFIDDVNSNHWNNFFGIKRPFFSETTSDFKFRLFKQRLKLCTLEEKSTTTFCFFCLDILGMEEVLHQLIGSFPHYLRGVIHPRWCRISSINGIGNVWPLFFLEWSFWCSWLMVPQ